ncbi:hypothetical protein H7100_01830 [Candidatus Saccharibacteria bacterium]|nr:hypothetical protein [Candidatus Saccharibacteria bacterium]
MEFIHYTNQETEKSFETIIEASYQEVRQYLKHIPEKLDIYFGDKSIIIPETGVGGFAYSHGIMTLAIDEDFPDKKKQNAELRATVFHESFHISQHFTGEEGFQTALNSAIYEGCATVFERAYAGTRAIHGDYSAHSDEQLESWLIELKAVGSSYFEQKGVWEKWAFYNEDLDQRWIVYKTGTWLIDRILQKTGLDILDLQDKTAEQILAL